MKVINLSEQNSVLNQFLREIRDVNIQKDPLRFRRNIERIGEVMAIEVSKTLDYQPVEVQTPLATATVNTITDQLVLATILRAGLPLHQGFLNIFDRAENAFLSAYRRMGRNVHGEERLEIVAEYMAAPAIDGKTLLVVDPMLATGMSMEVGYLALLRHGTPKHTHLCCAIATPQSVEYMRRELNDSPDVTLWCAAIDPVLNEKKYIVPGLGDAGDLCYGTKIHLSDHS
jgi:uracil phosphoribosyltransferase